MSYFLDVSFNVFGYAHFGIHFDTLNKFEYNLV